MTIDNLIRDTLWNELPECYDEPSISTAYQGANLSERSNMTLGERLDVWLENVAETIRPNTLTRYRGTVKNHIKPQLGHKVISQITPKDIQKFYDRLLTCGKLNDGGGLSDNTVRGCHSLCSRALEQASIIGSEVVITDPKTKAAVRTLILPPQVVKVFREYRTRVDSQWLFPSPKKADSPRLPTSIHQRLDRILDHAGCERVRFHDLRRTFATNALAHGMDIKTLSTILGHVSSATTLNTYSHVTAEENPPTVRLLLSVGKHVVKRYSSKIRTADLCCKTACLRGYRQFSKIIIKAYSML